MISFIATTTTTYIDLINQTNTIGHTSYFDNVICRIADVDRSVKAKGLQVFGSLTKAAVASGAALMGYSGFSAANYFEQPYNSDLDFGTGDFCVMGWLKSGGTDDYAFGLRNVVVIGANQTTGTLYYYDATAGNLNDGVTVGTSSDWKFVVAVRRSGVVSFYINAGTPVTGNSTQNLGTSGVLTIGNLQGGDSRFWSGSLALWRASATTPSAEQIRHIYETERPMFEANASCILAGSSNAVTALAYDEDTDLLHVGTSYGRSTFKGLTRVSSEATAIGAFTALSASGGIIVQGGASGVDVYIPAYSLREELARKAEQTAKLGAVLEPHWFTATNAQVAFALPIGWKPKFVYRNSQLIRPDANDYSDTFDGFIWTTTLIDASTTGDFICIMGVRTNG
jgi:hypothetical protein